MSQLERLKEEEQGRRAKKASSKASAPLMVSFHPNREEIEILKVSTFGILEAMDVLENVVSDWGSMTVGHKPENGSFYALIRDKRVDYQQAKALSYWHSTLEKAIIGLGFALATRYSGFPDGAYQPNLGGDDW